MAAPAKYLFDRSFEPSQEAPSPEQQLRTEFEAELAQARKAAFEEGHAEGLRAAQDNQEAAISETLSKVLANFTAITNDMESVRHDMQSKAVQIGLAAAETMAPEVIRRYPLEGLEALFKDCLEYADNPPHIAVRVNESLIEELQQRMESFAKQQGYQGEIVLVGDPEIPVGDAKLEWADGGIGHEAEATRSRIIKTVTAYLDGQRALIQGA